MVDYITTALDWVKENYTILIVLGFFVVLIFWKNIKAMFKKKDKVHQQVAFNPSLYHSEDISITLERQKETILSKLAAIQEEGQRIKSEETELEKEYSIRKSELINQTNELGRKHSVLNSQLEATDKMIAQQKQFEKC